MKAGGDRAARQGHVSIASPEQRYIQRRDFSMVRSGARVPGFVTSTAVMDRRRFSARRWRRRTDADKVDRLLDLLTGDQGRTPRSVVSAKITGLPYTESTPTVPNMKSVGMMDGKPIYMIDESVPPAQGLRQTLLRRKTPAAYGTARRVPDPQRRRSAEL